MNNDLSEEDMGEGLVSLAFSDILKGDLDNAKKRFSQGEELKRQSILKTQYGFKISAENERSKLQKLYESVIGFAKVNDERSFRIASKNFIDNYPASKNLPLFDNRTLDVKTNMMNSFKEGAALNLLRMKEAYIQNKSSQKIILQNKQDKLYLDQKRFMALQHDYLQNEILRQRKEGIMPGQAEKLEIDKQRIELQKEQKDILGRKQQLQEMAFQQEQNKQLMQRTKDVRTTELQNLGQQYAAAKVQFDRLKTPEAEQQFNLIRDKLGSTSLDLNKQLALMEKSDAQLLKLREQIKGFDVKNTNLDTRIQKLGSKDKSGFLQLGEKTRETSVRAFVNQILDESYGVTDFFSKPTEEQKEFFRDEVAQNALYFAYHNPTAPMDTVLSQGVKKTLGSFNIKQHFEAMSKNISSLSSDKEDSKPETEGEDITNYEPGKQYKPGTLVRFEDPTTGEVTIRQW